MEQIISRAIIPYKSVPTTNEEFSIGYPHLFVYWKQYIDCIKLLSKSKFNRGDVASIYKYPGKDGVFVLEPIEGAVSKQEYYGLPILQFAASVVPLSIGVDYEFKTLCGDVSVIYVNHIEADGNGSYIWLCIVESDHVIIEGRDAVYGDKCRLMLNIDGLRKELVRSRYECV